jgi:hypothetical protein
MVWFLSVYDSLVAKETSGVSSDNGARSEIVYIEEMGELIDRAPHTIRQWIREERLPKDLLPEREGGRQKIFWRRSKVEKMKVFAEKQNARRGWGSQSS